MKLTQQEGECIHSQIKMKKQKELYKFKVSESYKNVTSGFIKKDVINRFTDLDSSLYDASTGVLIPEYYADDLYPAQIIEEMDEVEDGIPVLNKKRNITIKSQKSDKDEINGIWNFYEFDAKKFDGMTDEEIKKLFLEHHKKRKEKLVAESFPLGIRPNKFAQKNLVVNGLIDTIINRMINSYTSAEDLVARKIAIGYSNTNTAPANAQLGREGYRFDFEDAFKNENIASFYVLLNRDDANGEQAEIVDDPNNTTTYFKVTNGCAGCFKVGEVIRVQTATEFNFVTITNVDVINDFITVDSPLADDPVGGEPFIQVISEAGIFGNGGTSGATNTGTLFNRVNNINFVKDDSKIILIEIQFIFVAK